MGYKDYESSSRARRARPWAAMRLSRCGLAQHGGLCPAGQVPRAGLGPKRMLLSGGAADEKQAGGVGLKLEGRRQEEVKNWHCRSSEKGDAHTFHLLVSR